MYAHVLFRVAVVVRMSDAKLSMLERRLSVCVPVTLKVVPTRTPKSKSVTLMRYPDVGVNLTDKYELELLNAPGLTTRPILLPPLGTGGLKSEGEEIPIALGTNVANVVGTEVVGIIGK